MNKPGTLLGGTLLVAGTCIGGGVLALPVITGMSGFVPSIALYLLCWVFMASTGLLYLEVADWMEGESNIISMAEKTLGRFGKAGAWAVYLFFFYCLTIAYIAGCGSLLAEIFPIPNWIGPIAIVAAFSPFVFSGAKVVGRLNLFLMLGLALSYFAFILTGYQFVSVERLAQKNWSLSFVALPVIFAAFGYQGIIPTLNSYFHRNLPKTRQAILLGSFLPLIFYVVWQWLILGIVPADGEGGLAEALDKGYNAVHPLKTILGSSHVYVIGQFFAFFALSTSFFGVTLGLQDFLADGLKVEKNRKGKLLLGAIVFIPPTVIATVNPHIFVASLNVAGGIGSALLLGLLPIMMVWSGRYRLGLPHSGMFPGKKLALCVLVLFVLIELVLELTECFGGIVKMFCC